MIVCPVCRHANEEEAKFCSRCGASLEPGPTALLPRREAAPKAPLEVPAPRPPSRARPWVVLGALVLVGAGALAGWLLRPDPCRGATFVSEQFGYCVVTPEGWVASQAQVGDVQLDQFQVPSESATVFVEAVDLTADMGLEDFGELVRQKDEDAGLVPGPVRETRLGGVPAQQWDVTVSSGGGIFKVREVVAVRDEVGWRITLNDTSDGFEAHADDLRRMLDSWRFV